jgi:hypothetical protein
MTTPISGGLNAWRQRIEDRLRRLENRKRITLGSWVLVEENGEVLLRNNETGETKTLT